MTNVAKKKGTDNMHSHTVKAFEIIDEYLPYQYVEEVQEICKKPPGSIRNARIRKKGNMQIINALLTVALRYKEQQEKLQELINQ